ncbi:metal cation-transporting ATPase, partial [Ramicandelaber brevisporus]
MRAYHTWNSHSPVYVWVSQYGDRADLFLNRVGSFVRSFLGAVIVYQNMLPMMWFTFGDICRAAHVYFIRYDLQLYDRQTNSPAKPRSWGFTDELGQVSHILTDKTGTLTDNAKMALQTVSVAVGDSTALYGTDEDANTLSYRREVVELRKRIINDSLDLDPELDNYEAKNEFSFSDKAVFNDLAESSSDRAIALGAFWTCATVCHDVSIAQSSLGFNSNTSAPVVDPRKPFYGSSAEEIAVVDAARVVGFRFLSRTADSLTISFPGNQQCAFQVLRVFPFSDDRRRMTVVVKDPQGQVIAFTKGADDAMFPFAATPDAAAQSSLNKLRSDATEFAAAGLRTLIYATRAFAPESYAKWEKRYEQALSAVKSNPSDKVYRRRLIESVEALENQFTLVGAVGIEDPLRPDIPETVETLFRAGMRIWMVTGDRSETAM